MAITIVGVSAAVASSATAAATVAPAYPAGYTAVADDYCVMVVAHEHEVGSSSPAGTPSGYSGPITSHAIAPSSADPELNIFYKKLTVSEAAPTVTVVTTAAPTTAALVIVRGADLTTFLDATSVASSTTGTTATTFTPTGITTATNGAMVLSVVSTNDDNTGGITLTSGSEQGFTGQMTGESYQTAVGTDNSLACASKEIASASAVTCPQYEMAAAETWVGLTLAIRPAGGGGTTSANLINSNLLAGRLLRGLKG